jgi:hypothetical protein
MRTTLDIEDDILAAAKEMARLQPTSTGQIIPKLLRDVLTGHQWQGVSAKHETKPVGGFRPFPARGVLVTDQQVNDLRDQEVSTGV